MPLPTLVDMLSRTGPMAKKWVPKKADEPEAKAEDKPARRKLHQKRDGDDAPAPEKEGGKHLRYPKMFKKG